MSVGEATEPKDIYDVVIIGAGPAGLAAGMYCARQGLATAIVSGTVGGQAAWASKIENYLGWQLVTGPELVERFREHVSGFDVDCFEGQLVNAMVETEEGFDVFTREGATLSARAVIIATGRAPNRLAVPGETEFIGRGVSYCATCDAAFFTGKDVMVTGPGESACEAALQLAALGAAQVILVSEKALKAPAELLDKLQAESRIEVRPGAKVVRIEGGDHVESVVVAESSTGEERPVGVEGLFIELGAIPVAEFTGGLVETNDKGEVIVDKRCATSRPGLYAAGDVTDGLGKQVIIAAGEGARAAVAAASDLKRRPDQRPKEQG